jgi:hypothetical protein
LCDVHLVRCPCRAQACTREHPDKSTPALAAQVVDLNALYRTDFEEVRRDNPELMIEMHKAIYRNQPAGANAEGRSSQATSSREDEAGARTGQATRMSDATEAGDTTVLVGSRSFASVMSQLAVKTEFSSRLIKAITDKV